MTRKHDHHDNEDIDIVADEDTKPHKGFGKSDSTLRDELKQANADKQEYLEGWQRAKADLINVKRDAEKAGAEAASRATLAFATDLLPVLDSFDMAMANRDAWESAPKNWRDGVEYIHQQLLGVLRDRGIEAFDPIGEHFDPRIHESVEHVPVEDAKLDHTVVATLSKGYRMGDTLVRPARVHVGRFEE